MNNSKKGKGTQRLTNCVCVQGVRYSWLPAHQSRCGHSTPYWETSKHRLQHCSYKLRAVLQQASNVATSFQCCLQASSNNAYRPPAPLLQASSNIYTCLKCCYNPPAMLPRAYRNVATGLQCCYKPQNAVTSLQQCCCKPLAILLEVSNVCYKPPAVLSQASRYPGTSFQQCCYKPRDTLLQSSCNAAKSLKQSC